MRPRGRPLQPRSDTERLDYLEKLLGFGRARNDVGLAWEGAKLELYAGAMNDFQKTLASDDGLRQLLDRAISRKAKP